MVWAPKAEGEGREIPLRVRRTIQGIKEAFRDHSDADIYAALRDSGMNPDEAAQKLLNQDPFHEVKRKRDKKRESTGDKSYGDTDKPIEHHMQWSKAYTLRGQNVQRHNNFQQLLAGTSQKFRVVKDNRANQDVENVELEQVQHATTDNKKMASNLPGQSSMLSQGVNLPADSVAKHYKGIDPSGNQRPLSSEAMQAPAATSQSEMVIKNLSHSHSAQLTSANYRTGGTQRGSVVLGVHGRAFAHPATNSSSNRPFSGPLSGRGIFPSRGLSRRFATQSQSNQPSHHLALEPISSISFSKSSSMNQYPRKRYQQCVGTEKAIKANMEWRPKSSQMLNSNNDIMVGTTSATSISFSEKNCDSKEVSTAGLSEKLSQINVSEDQPLVIPQHLRVPESEHMRLTFGSFDFSPLQTFENKESTSDPSISSSAVVPDATNDDAPYSVQGDALDFEPRTSQSGSPFPAEESEKIISGNDESYSLQNIQSYADIGLVESNSPPYDSVEDQDVHNSSSLPGFSEYDPQTNYDVSLFQTTFEGGAHGQGFASTSEALGLHATSNSSSCNATIMQQPLQQQPVAQLYPPVHISHFPNFVPYRHVYSPVYMPPMAVPNYSGNSPFPHPSSGNSYLVMPGGNTHITSGGMKYTASLHKPTPGSAMGYGNYMNPTAFSISTSGTVGAATGLEDATRIKYKDNNLYMPSLQSEASDIWVQTPRELASLQSAPFYNVTGQAPHPAFLPPHAGHASFNAATAQTSHVPYQGLYPPQPATIANTHHLVQQQVPPGLSGNVGVGVAAPGPQVGAYQQPQLSHLNWTANF